jgi:chemotaxis methyl-accepting protein methylase
MCWRVIVQFDQVDLLTDEFSKLGQFDTVTAIGVIEHFPEADMYRVLRNLLKVTAHRLILIVPYEQEVEVIYDHKQTLVVRSSNRWDNGASSN